MIHLQRGPAPECWTRENVKRWKDQWLAKNCESARWQWPQYQRRTINEYACESMESWHHGKCAFCETTLQGGREIEHFRSKTQHPLAAFSWRNLFLICRDCNKAKGAQNHEGCLKPDRDDPVNYLWINPISLKVEPKPGISDEARQCAINTIERYQLDRPELTRLYETYYRGIASNHLFPVAALAARVDKQLQTPAQIPLRLEGLRALVNPEQPFSLFVKSLLEYYNYPL